MVEHLKNKRPRGRPKGSSQRSIATIVVVKNELAKALDLLEERSKAHSPRLYKKYKIDLMKKLLNTLQLIKKINRLLKPIEYIA